MLRHLFHLRPRLRARTLLFAGALIAFTIVGRQPSVAEASHIDLDGDGELELAFSDPGRAPGAYLVVNADGDGDPDAIFVGTSDGGTVFATTLSITGNANPEIIVESPSVSPGSLLTANVDADADIDVIWVGASGGASIEAYESVTGDSGIELLVANPAGSPGTALAADAEANAEFDVIWAGTSGGGAIEGTADITGNSSLELLISDPSSAPGTVLTADPEVNAEFDVIWAGTSGGGALEAIADITGNSSLELLISDPSSAPGTALTADPEVNAEFDVIWAGTSGGGAIEGTADITGNSGQELIVSSDATAAGTVLTADPEVNAEFDVIWAGTSGGGEVWNQVADITGNAGFELVVANPAGAPGTAMTADPETNAEIDVIWAGTSGGGAVWDVADITGNSGLELIVLNPAAAHGTALSADPETNAEVDLIWPGTNDGSTPTGVTSGQLHLNDPTLSNGQTLSVDVDIDATADVIWDGVGIAPTPTPSNTPFSGPPSFTLTGALSITDDAAQVVPGATLEWVCTSGYFGSTLIQIRFESTTSGVSAERAFVDTEGRHRSQLPTAVNRVTCRVNGVVIRTYTITWRLIDPSGIITNEYGVPVPQATVTLEYDIGGGNFQPVTPAAPPPLIDPDVNPQLTSLDGRYAWDVEPGTYRVTVQKSGCTTATSGSVMVPPPATDVDLQLACTDTDGDGIPGFAEFGLGLSAVLEDTDGDEIPDGDEDADGDGLTNMQEILLEGTAPLEDDSDGDGVGDLTDPFPLNCPDSVAAGALNVDGNFIELSPKLYDDLTLASSDIAGNACDLDDDNDGRTDDDEIAGTGCAATNPIVADTDGDHAIDGAECALGTDPNNVAIEPSIAACGAVTDTDGDKVLAFREICYYGTDPAVANGDGDTRDDGCEVYSINADLTVNVIDLQQIASESGMYASPGSAVKVDFDVTKDGAINVIDLQQTAAADAVCP